MDEKSDQDNKNGASSWYINERFAKFWYCYNRMMMTAHRDAIVRAKYKAAHRKATLMRMLIDMKRTTREASMHRGNQSSCCTSKTPSEIARAKRNKKKRKRKK